MKRAILTVLLLQILVTIFCQDTRKVSLYNPADNAREEISKKIKEAKAEGKYVFIQVGNNACIWCLRFHSFLSTDKMVDSIFRANYVIYHLNTNPENPNEKLLAGYRFPQRFGYPVFLILDGKGELLHTQNSEYLEAGAGYNRKAVIEFLSQWAPKALDPAQYKQR
ncbi:MAG TPA: thioredoxin family protein [Chitinophagaceae bacterium]